MPYKDPAARRARLRLMYRVKREQRLAAHKAWRDANKTHCAAYRKAYRGPRSAEHRRDRYGLTPDMFNEMHARQEGRCAVCREKPKGTGNSAVLHVDHDHVTGKVRELLCQRCNKALGGFRDSQALLARAMWYLQKHRENAANTA